MSNKAVFWDRDGTLIKHHDYLTNVDDVALMRGASGAIKYLAERGYKAVVVTNQSAVARGMITEKQLAEINRRFTSLLTQEGAVVDKLYYCPFHPEAVVEQYRQDSELRKPKPGMLLAGAKDLGLDLSQCWMIGDDDRDILAGQAAGCRTILIQARSTELVRRGGSAPDYIACSPQEAANIVAHYGSEQSVGDPEPEPGPVDNDDSGLAGQAIGHGNCDESQQVTQADSSPEGDSSKDEVVSLKKETPPKKNKGNAGKSKAKNQSKGQVVPDKSSSAVDQPVKNETEPDQIVEKTVSIAPDRVREVSDNQLLNEILRELKKHNVREDGAKSDFSGASLLAGITQIVVLLCLLMAYTATGGLEPSYDKVQAWLSAGLVFQVMTLSLLMMNR